MTADSWYKYDGRNHYVLAKGTLSGGAITGGTYVEWNANYGDGLLNT